MINPAVIPTISQLSSPLESSVFKLSKIEHLSLPHPYCITPRHVAHAADHFNGMLGKAAMEDAERHGAKCGMRGCRLPLAEHKNVLTLFIDVPRTYQRDLNGCPGLGAYLTSIKARAVELGIDGFAFPAAEE